MSNIRSRRRAEVLVEAIRQATRDELGEHGYAGVTYEGVARRAGTSKPVLYRRYRSRAYMVLDAVSANVVDEVPDLDTGSLREDLLALLHFVAARFQQTGLDVHRGLIGESIDDLAGAVTRMTTDLAYPIIRSMLEAARARGELTTTDLPQRVVLLPLVMLRHEWFFHQPFDPNAITDMIDSVYLPLLRQYGQAA